VTVVRGNCTEPPRVERLSNSNCEHVSRRRKHLLVVDTTSAEHVDEKVRFVDHSNRLTVVTTRLKCGMMIFGDSNIYKHWGSGQQGADTEHESFNDIKNTKDEDDVDSGYGGDDKVDEFEQIARKSGSKLLEWCRIANRVAHEDVKDPPSSSFLKQMTPDLYAEKEKVMKKERDEDVAPSRNPPSTSVSYIPSK
jgi:hypothetical protein